MCIIRYTNSNSPLYITHQTSHNLIKLSLGKTSPKTLSLPLCHLVSSIPPTLSIVAFRFLILWSIVASNHVVVAHPRLDYYLLQIVSSVTLWIAPSSSLDHAVNASKLHRHYLHTRQSLLTSKSHQLTLAFRSHCCHSPLNCIIIDQL